MKTPPSEPFISVIIPTFNRADLLAQSLESLVGQSLPNDLFEVVVIDDGSPDHTGEVCRSFARRLPLKYLKQNNSGISAAKNMGLFVSRGPLLLFFDDDDVADINLLKEHVHSHSLHPEENVAVLGYTTWHPSLQVNRVMDFVMNIGHFLFSYSSLKDGQALDFTYFWGGRSSCKKSLLVRHGIFNQLFRFGSEDIELGYRLSKLGLKVIYNEKARSYMIRPLTYDQFCQRCVKQGRSQYHFSRMHPDRVIQKYCMMDEVEQKWNFVRRALDNKMQRVRDIEKALEAGLPPAKQKTLLKELGKAYWWTFSALKIKGIVEEKASDSTLSRNDDTTLEPQSLPDEDIAALCTRWGTSLPGPCHRGNVLIIDPFLPMFDRASGSLRLFEIIKALIRLDFRVTFIARNGELAGIYVPILQDMGVEVHAGDPSALQEQNLDIIAPYLDVEKILKSKTFDYVILSFWHVAEYYLPLVRAHSPESHVIVDTVDIHFLREFRAAEIKKDPKLMETAKDNKERELAVYRKGDRLWVVTEEDRKVIENLVAAPVDVIPNIHKKIESAKEYSSTSDLLFVGNFNHKPNIDAVLFLHREIFPLIRRQLPDVKVLVVGNNPPEQVRHLNSGRFVITGYVEDLSSYLKNARISINPLTYGAGMKGKVGEALSWGLPVVTTSIGAEGMHLKDGEDAMIADDPQVFAQKVIDLYNDRVLWERLSRNGKKLVEQRWSPATIQKRIDSSFLDARSFREGNVSVVLMSSDDGEELADSVSSLHSFLQTPGETVVIERFSCQRDPRHRLALENMSAGSRSVRVIAERAGTAPLSSWNRALSLCTGDTIVMCRRFSDTGVSHLRAMISSALQHTDIDILTSRNPFLPGARRSGDALSPNSERNFSPSGFRMTPSPFMIIRSSAVKGIGGFDSSFWDNRVGWHDFILRASLQGLRVTSMEEVDASSGMSCEQNDDIEPPQKDWTAFAKKWDLQKDAKPISASSIAGKENIAPFRLFSSLGDQGSEDSSAHSHARGQASARTSVSPEPTALSSIIILCFNGLSYTRQCLDSIEKFTPEPHEIIIVDNGSTDGTAEFLARYAEEYTNVKLIMNEDNKGYAAGNNQAIGKAQGEYVVLLNNDVVVTHGWLGRMIGHIEGSDETGMVGPVSNSVSGAQLIPQVPYGNDLDRMHAFAEEIGNRNAGKEEPCMRLVGFCLLIRRQVLEIIGGLDEGYKTGNFEDDDLCLRSCVAGYKNIVAQDVFVHHFGSMAFKENAINYSGTMDVNRSYFFKKWKGIVHQQKNNSYSVHVGKTLQVEKLIQWCESAFENGDILRALKILERAILIDPQNSKALNDLGVIQWQLGDRDAAIETFQALLLMNPDDIDALSNLSESISAGGNSDMLRPEVKALFEKKMDISQEEKLPATAGDLK